MARKFLYVVAFFVVLALAGLLAYRSYGPQLLRWSLKPTAPFQQQPALPANAWTGPALWIARPGLPDDPAQWLPPGVARAPAADAAVFFIHPTSYLDKARWNAPLDDADANARAALFVRAQASAFTAAGQIWAPRYRQATFGAFISGEPDAARALDLAYRDVAQAFDAFLAAQPPDRPLILAAHSQGSLHLIRLLKERVAGTPLAARVVAAYAVGWPVSRTADLPALGLPACAAPAQSGCLVSWLSYAEPADPSQFFELFDGSQGLTGSPRRGTAIVCTNPLTGSDGGGAPAQANLGAVVPNADLSNGTLTPGAVPARCDGRGILLIGPPPGGFGGYVLPGNNYHVFDYSLFWANVRADAARRLAAWREAHGR